ncbi:ATP-binding protein [Undibacterium sp. TC9W]|uniref:ATP-binding protein n=1 Tax=Undibacterium sp. TC9W TaxID=3413053 RepID=UPI003BF2784F
MRDLPMINNDFSGSAEINDEGIKKHFKNYDSWQAIFELIWNGFDANAKSVTVSVEENELGSTELVWIIDDGDGIDFLHPENNFKKFNDSLKKEDADQHGSHGRGRLAFHKLCHKATWHTRFNGADAQISINESSIKKFSGIKIDSKIQHPKLKFSNSGTCVELSNIHQNLPAIEKLIEHLANEFGWYLALNPSRSITVNGNKIPVPAHEIFSKKINAKDIAFEIKVICWDQKPSSEKSYTYLLNSNNKVVHRELSSLNNKANFFTSVYVSSSWADHFCTKKNDLFTVSENNPESQIWKILSKELGEFTQSVYDAFLRKFVDFEIEKFSNDGVFPEYKGEDPSYAKWKLSNTKELVKTIFLADPSVFSSLNKKQRKIIVRFLDKLAVSNENDSLFEVLDSVLDLDSSALNTLAYQLKRTKLENIIATIEVLQRRQQAVDKLREIMNFKYKDVLETPDLQKIIENNTWLFGPKYETIGAEEDSFTKIVKDLRNALKDINQISNNDLEDGATIEGAKRQVDLFLARKMPTLDSAGNKIFKCVIIEIKRPSVALNVTHLRQLDDYAAILKKYPAFSSEKIHFELILVGRKISNADTEIGSRLSNLIHKGELGLVTDDGSSKRYVKNWFTILDEFDLSNGFMLQNLKLQRDSYTEVSETQLIDELQTIPN